MNLTNTGILRILVADEGYKLYSPSSNSYFDKIYLGINDSENNYREISIDDIEGYEPKKEVEKLKNELKSTNEKVSDYGYIIDTTLFAIDEIYNMIEPTVASVENTLGVQILGEDNVLYNNEDTDKKVVNKIASFYKIMIDRRLKTIDEIPIRYKEQVESMLNKKIK